MSSLSALHIGIVGAGKMGGVFASHFTEAGHTVKIANSRGPETLTDLAQRTGATATSIEDAVKDAQLVVVTVPLRAIIALGAQGVFNALPAEVIVCDTGNYYADRDGPITELDKQAVTDSRWVEQQLGHAVIKVFNNIFFMSLMHGGKPSSTLGRIALPVAGDNPQHKETVIALLDQLGFDGVDAGSIDDSWRQQPASPVYVTDFDAAGVKSALSRADRVKQRALSSTEYAGWVSQFKAGTPQCIPAWTREFVAEQYGQ